MSWLIAFNVVNSYNPTGAGSGILYRVTEPGLRPICAILPNPAASIFRR
jgi:uncharacterized protein YggT (Ycf19 family)